MSLNAAQQSRSPGSSISGTQQPVMAIKGTYTVEDIQAILGISRSSAYYLVNSGQFRAIKVGRQIRVPIKGFEQWLEGQINV